MDDRRTPMEAEVQEYLPARERCADDSYGTAVRPRPQRSYVGLWVCVGLAVITACTFCVVGALSQLRVENGNNGFHISMGDSEETQAPEDPIRSLTIPDEGDAVSAEGDAGEIRLPLGESSDEALTSAEIYERVSPAVVCVSAESGYGSTDYTGVVVNPDGYVLTAIDDLNNAVSVNVTLSDGRVFSARRLGEDPVSGVCLLKINAEGLQTVRFSEQTDFSVGQRVYTICNPYGSLIPNVFYDGMLSASCSVNLYYHSYTVLQFSAQPESSSYGAPLLDERGLVIGITTPIGQGLVNGKDPRFAIISADLGRIVTELENKASRGSVWRGLEVENIPEGYRYLFGYPGAVWISSIAPGSPLDGKLYQNDIIVAIDGVEITDAAQFERIVNNYEFKDQVLLTICRNGRLIQIQMSVLAK